PLLPRRAEAPHGHLGLRRRADPRGTPRCPPALPGGAAVRHARCVAGARRGRGAPETRARPREGRPLSHRRERGPLSLAPGVAKRATLCARSEALGEMTTKEPGRRGLRVMIVEDEEAVRDVFRDFLAGLGHESIPVTTAAPTGGPSLARPSSSRCVS